MDKSPTSIEIGYSLPSGPAVPWTSRDVTWGLTAFVLWVVFFVIVGLLGEQLSLPLDPGLVIIFGEAVLLFPVWYFTVYKYGSSWADLGLRRFSLQAVGIGCGLMAVSFLINLVYAGFLALFDRQVQPDIALIFESTRFPLALLFGGAVVAPFVEEIFFRGFVFSGLRGKWNWKLAALASSALFALAHILPTSMLPIFILGLVFAFLYQISGSIWPSILMHVLTNTLALTAAYASSQGWLPSP